MEKVKIEILSTKVICKVENRYLAWPTIIKTIDKELLVIFSGDRDCHVCPWGKTQMIRSRDSGKNWSTIKTINNTVLDDRDAGIVETRSKTLIVSWFTSLAFDDDEVMKNIIKDDKERKQVMSQWKRHSEKINKTIRKEWLGSWIRRSIDSGKNWGKPIQVPVSAPHGPIQISDGRILYLGKRLYTPGNKMISLIESKDDGLNWDEISSIPLQDGVLYDHCHEPHIVECKGGKLLALIRYQPEDADAYIMLQSESFDGGFTWTEAHSTGLWGFPPHLLKLNDNRLLLSYTMRRKPYGQYACISSDNGNSWNPEKIIQLSKPLDDDHGYPSSVQLEDDSILTVYYEIDKIGEKPCLKMTNWKL